MHPGVQRTDVPTMVVELRFLDGQRGPEALAGLKRLGLPMPPVVESVLATNVPTDRPAGSADTIRIGTGVYVQAYDQLLVPWGKLTGVVAPVDTASTASAVGGTMSEGDEAGKPSASSSSSSSPASNPVLGMLAVAVGALVVLVAGAIVIAVSRRRRASGGCRRVGSCPWPPCSTGR